VKTTNETYPELISLACHEFRGAAGVVGGYLRMVQTDRKEKLSPRHRKLVEEAAKSCAKFSAIVEELSQVSKLDDGRLKLKAKPLDVFSLVEEVAELVHEAKEREVFLTVSGPATGARLSGDAELLKQAFDGIFRAIVREKARDCTVVVERRIENIDGHASAILIVAEADSVQVAYDREAGPFLFLHRGGVGLALPLARRVIEAHGGRLWAPLPEEGLPESGAMPKDVLARSSAIISLPITELPR
jgi:two-component system cell cycle sensor histidine kinase PleC